MKKCAGCKVGSSVQITLMAAFFLAVTGCGNAGNIVLMGATVGAASSYRSTKVPDSLMHAGSPVRVDFASPVEVTITRAGMGDSILLRDVQSVRGRLRRPASDAIDVEVDAVQIAGHWHEYSRESGSQAHISRSSDTRVKNHSRRLPFRLAAATFGAIMGVLIIVCLGADIQDQ
jgi:hypothetical protein